VIVPHCPLRERRRQCTQRLGSKSLPYCPVGLSAALGFGNHLVEYVQFKGVGGAGYRSEPTCLFSIGHWMISSGSKSDAATLLHSGTQISSQVKLHHYVLVTTRRESELVSSLSLRLPSDILTAPSWQAPAPPHGYHSSGATQSGPSDWIESITSRYKSSN
jgi:hypothetical protein